jgi:hypothetical protein
MLKEGFFFDDGEKTMHCLGGDTQWRQLLYFGTAGDVVGESDAQASIVCF